MEKNGVLSEQQYDALDIAMQDEELRRIVAETGYAYDWRQNIFYSVLNPWQREMGYCRLYDEAAAPLGLVFDCDPVYFEYAGKKWLIEMWKGQYGITTGAEIGIYTTTGPDLNIPGVFNGTFYNSADDADCLSMTYVLLKNGKVLFNRAARHWWLTGFVLGEYTDPSELTMEVSITFKDQQMRDAFLGGLYEIGYTQDRVRHGGNTVLILFTTPLSKQPFTRDSFIGDKMLQQLKKNIDIYKGITGGKNDIQDVLKAYQYSPQLSGMMLKMGRQKEMLGIYQLLLQHLS